MTATTRDYEDIELEGSIDSVIATLRALKKKYPDGEISIDTEYEYGESYTRTRVGYSRPKTDAEIEYDKWQQKLGTYRRLLSAKATYDAEGDSYPRQAEVDALAEELGVWSKSRFGSLKIMAGEVIMFDFDGGLRRDETWAFRRMGALDFMKATSQTQHQE